MEIKDHIHRNGQRNELRNWSLEKLTAHPILTELYAGRYWQFLGDNKIYYSPDGVLIKPIASDTAQLAIGAPKVTISANHLGTLFELQENNEIGGAVIPNAQPMQLIKVSADTLPDEVYALAALYQPRIELMTYRVRTQRNWYTRAGAARRSGWKHPDDATFPAAPDGWKGGGNPTYSHAATALRRRTEWPVSARTEIFDVTQAAIGRLTYCTSIFYRDGSGNTVYNGTAVIPIDCRYKNQRFGRRKAWGGNVRDARIAFRISIIDPNAPKKTRLYGPMTHTICVGSAAHPFLPDAPFLAAGVYYPTAKINPAYTPKRLGIFLGERLP